jgi:hypothetical protein
MLEFVPEMLCMPCFVLPNKNSENKTVKYKTYCLCVKRRSKILEKGVDIRLKPTLRDKNDNFVTACYTRFEEVVRDSNTSQVFERKKKKKKKNGL